MQGSIDLLKLTFDFFSLVNGASLSKLINKRLLP